MKSVLLLLAIYSLIFHQWHKEKGSAKSRLTQNQQFLVEKKSSDHYNAVRYTVAAQFLNLYSSLNKR